MAHLLRDQASALYGESLDHPVRPLQQLHAISWCHTRALQQKNDTVNVPCSSPHPPPPTHHGEAKKPFVSALQHLSMPPGLQTSARREPTFFCPRSANIRDKSVMILSYFACSRIERWAVLDPNYLARTTAHSHGQGTAYTRAKYCGRADPTCPSFGSFLGVFAALHFLQQDCKGPLLLLQSIHALKEFCRLFIAGSATDQDGQINAG